MRVCFSVRVRDLKYFCFGAGKKKFLEEFKKFAIRGNVVDLAVAVIIGAAFGAIVTSLRLRAASVFRTTTCRCRRERRPAFLMRTRRNLELGHAEEVKSFGLPETSRVNSAAGWAEQLI